MRVSDIDIEALKRDREQLLAEAVELEKTHGPLIMPPELTAELLRRQEEVTIVDDARERLNDFIADKLSVNPHYMFRKDELFGVMGVATPKSKDGKVLAHVTRQFGLRETKRTISGGKRVRVFVRQEAAETEETSEPCQRRTQKAPGHTDTRTAPSKKLHTKPSEQSHRTAFVAGFATSVGNTSWMSYGNEICKFVAILLPRKAERPVATSDFSA